MMPRRRVSGEISGNGVSYRVAVCRKRLRVSRRIPRGQSTPRLDSYPLTSPTDANKLIVRQLLPRQEQLAAIRVGYALNDVGVRAALEPDAVPEEKAEDTCS
jgi:hypothetical protein